MFVFMLLNIVYIFSRGNRKFAKYMLSLISNLLLLTLRYIAADSGFCVSTMKTFVLYYQCYNKPLYILFTYRQKNGLG